MCISATASVNSFLLNLIGCITLVYFGNQNLLAYNIIVAGLFIFISLMQLVDLGMWIDLKCKLGTNKIASALGPLLNFAQPFVAFIIIYVVLNYTQAGKKEGKQILKREAKYNWLKQFNIANNKINIIKIINVLYLIAIIFSLYKYYNSVSKDPNLLCTGIKNGNLNWNWCNTNNKYPIIYMFWHITIINILAINFSSPYIIIMLLLTYVMLFYSNLWVKVNVPAIWCYLVNCVPFILLIIQKLFPKYIK